jgi:hypothetical protein
MGVESDWIYNVYEKITAITDLYPIRYGISDGIHGKMEDEKMDTTFYLFNTDMYKLMTEFYRYVPEPPEEARKPDRFDSSTTVRREKRKFYDTWNSKYIAEKVTMQLIIRVNQKYEQYLAYVDGVCAKKGYYDLDSLLNQLRYVYYERKNRFKQYQQMMEMGGPEEWTKLEERKREEEEAAERARHDKKMKEEAIARDKNQKEEARMTAIMNLIQDRRDLEEKLEQNKKKFYSGQGDHRDLLEEENKIKSALRDVERREEDLLKYDPEGYFEFEKYKSKQGKRDRNGFGLQVLLSQLQKMSY